MFQILFEFCEIQKINKQTIFENIEHMITTLVSFFKMDAKDDHGKIKIFKKLESELRNKRTNQNIHQLITVKEV